jgi:hypothetical protein
LEFCCWAAMAMLVCWILAPLEPSVEVFAASAISLGGGLWCCFCLLIVRLRVGYSGYAAEVSCKIWWKDLARVNASSK